MATLLDNTEEAIILKADQMILCNLKYVKITRELWQVLVPVLYPRQLNQILWRWDSDIYIF